jgi:hypothetical protein
MNVNDRYIAVAADGEEREFHGLHNAKAWLAKVNPRLAHNGFLVFGSVVRCAREVDAAQKLPIPLYFERFIRRHFRAKHVDGVLSEFLLYAADGEGGSTYTRNAVAGLLAAREARKAPESLSYYGS